MRRGDLRAMPRRVGALTVVVALAFAVGACGEDDASTDGTAGAEADVHQAFAEFEESFHGGDAAKACERLTEPVIRELSQFAGSGDEACEPMLSRLSKAARKLEQQPSRILSVKVDGDEATASVSDAGRKPVPVSFVRESGAWKLNELSFGNGDAR